MSDPSTNELPPPPAQPETPVAKPGWRDRRVPWVVAGVGALLACLLGAGAATVGAVIVGHSDGDRDGPVQMRDRQFPGGRQDGGRPNFGSRDGRGNGRQAPGQPAPAPSGSTAPSPS